VSKNVPIIVNNNLPPQFYEALKLFNKDNRQIIKLRANKNYLVKKLYYPSRLSIVNDNYKQPIYHKDAIYSPDGIKFVRDTALSSLNCNNKKRKRKIFISRSGSDYRQLLNSNEIEELLIDKGFEIVFPENLSFYSQVKIFSEAEIIIGQSGAGMANFIFAPSDSKLVVLMSDLKENNFQIFNALANVNNMSAEFFIGKHRSSYGTHAVHADFYIDIEKFSDYIDRIL
jgi:capsular polysaccharide biosynthesis protein